MLRTAIVMASALLYMAASGCASHSNALKSPAQYPDGDVLRDAMLELSEGGSYLRAHMLEDILRQQPDAGARMIAVEMLARQNALRAVDELRETARRDRAWPVRAAAISALAHLQGPEAVEEVRAAMRRDRDAQVRVKALRELHRLLADEKDAAVEALEQALTDPAPVVRLQASDYMARLTGLTAAPDAVSWRRARSQ